MATELYLEQGPSIEVLDQTQPEGLGLRDRLFNTAPGRAFTAIAVSLGLGGAGELVPATADASTHPSIKPAQVINSIARVLEINENRSFNYFVAGKDGVVGAYLDRSKEQVNMTKSLCKGSGYNYNAIAWFSSGLVVGTTSCDGKSTKIGGGVSNEADASNRAKLLNKLGAAFIHSTPGRYTNTGPALRVQACLTSAEVYFDKAASSSNTAKHRYLHEIDLTTTNTNGKTIEKFTPRYARG